MGFEYQKKKLTKTGILLLLGCLMFGRRRSESDMFRNCLMVLLFAYTKKVSKRKIKDFAKLTDDKELFLHIQHHFAFSFLSLEVIRNIFFGTNRTVFICQYKHSGVIGQHKRRIQITVGQERWTTLRAPSKHNVQQKLTQTSDKKLNSF